MAARQIDFSQILNSLLSGDNAVRQSAEVSVFNIHVVASHFFYSYKTVEMKRKKAIIVFHWCLTKHTAKKIQSKKMSAMCSESDRQRGFSCCIMTIKTNRTIRKQHEKHIACDVYMMCMSNLY